MSSLKILTIVNKKIKRLAEIALSISVVPSYGLRCWCLTGFLIASSFAFAELNVSGNVSLEGRYFWQAAELASAAQSNLSLSAQPEWSFEPEQSQYSWRFSPFLRIDQRDNKRSHADIRELRWIFVEDDWEVTVGWHSVFWGVTETAHFVNVVNQIDAIENLDGEDYLGQPMVNLTLLNDWGNLDFFLLAGFQERVFTGRGGRPAATQRVSNSDAIYESSAEKNHIDWALRWSHSVDIWDIGLSHFKGTSREPRFDTGVVYGRSAISLGATGAPELVPIYDQLSQSGADIQATVGAWLFKLETIHGKGVRSFSAVASGVEYTFFDFAALDADLGILAEYLYDERQGSATNDDFSLGLRLGFNDINSSALLVAVVQDLENDSKFYFLEGSRRIGDAFKIDLEARGSLDVDPSDALSQIDTEDYIQIELAYYF